MDTPEEHEAEQWLALHGNRLIKHQGRYAYAVDILWQRPVRDKQLREHIEAGHGLTLVDLRAEIRDAMKRCPCPDCTQGRQ